MRIRAGSLVKAAIRRDQRARQMVGQRDESGVVERRAERASDDLAPASTVTSTRVATATVL